MGTFQLNAPLEHDGPDTAFWYGKPRRPATRPLARTIGRWLQPASVLSSVLALWRLGADLNLTGGFAVSHGLFSHWQVWMGMAVIFQLLASTLNRYGRGNDATMP